MYCPSCHSPNPVYRKYCLKCHLALDGTSRHEPGYGPDFNFSPLSAEDDRKAKARKKWLFDKIESREDALQFTQNASIAFFVVAGLQILLSILVGPGILVDACVYATGSFFLLKFQSRVAALVILTLAVANAWLTIFRIYKGDLAAAGGVVVSLITLVIAVRATESAFKLHGRYSLVAPKD